MFRDAHDAVADNLSWNLGQDVSRFKTVFVDNYVHKPRKQDLTNGIYYKFVKTAEK